jgi:hypothetical protein
MGGHQLERHRIPDLRQPSARYVLFSTVPRYGYSSRLMNSCTVLDPLGAQAIRRPGHLLGWGGEDVLGVSTSYIFKFYLFLTLLHNFNSLFHVGIFHLVKDISLETSNIVFDKAVRKVIKGTVKHARLISTTLYYS